MTTTTTGQSGSRGRPRGSGRPLCEKWSWKACHNKEVANGTKTEYNFFAAETWKCIQLLILSHVVVIQIYCLDQKISINPRTLNTDCVEHHFGDARQFAGGSTSRLSGLQFDYADFLSGISVQAKFEAVGNNRTAPAKYFSRPARF